MKVLLASVLLLFSLTTMAADSSETDSLITVKQIYNSTEPHPLNINKADKQAQEMCRLRGFNTAERLGEEKQLCDRYTGWYECYYRRVEQLYQCSNQ
jgi:ABC-type oligopeptide transport system substrate-binding subunit